MNIAVKEEEPEEEVETEMEQFPATNPNPVLSVGKDGTVLYSNVAGEPLLHEWGVTVGEKLPSIIGFFVQRVISGNNPKKMEVKAGKRVYLVTFHPLPEKDCVSVYGFDISDQKKFEKKLIIKEKQNDILYKIGKIALEYESLQAFMDESVKLIASILEQEYCKIMELMPDGKFLLKAGTGWKPEFVGKNVVEGGKGSQAGYTLLSRMPVIVDDFKEEYRFEKPEILKIHGVVSGASVVIGSMKKIYGVLIVNSTKKRMFTSDDIYFLNSVAFLIAQVVERKKMEEALKKAHDNLDEKVKERTTQLEKTYNSLKESEGRLAEAQKMAHIGNWVWDIATDKEYWSNELYRIFKRDPQEAAPSYKEYLNYVHPDDRDYVDNAFKGTINGKPYEIDHRIILANGEERTVHIQAEVVFNDKNIPIQTKGIVQDITERKKAEEKIQNLANIVESSNDAIGTISLDDIITNCNKETEQVYGYSAKEILGKPTSFVAPPHLDKETKKLSELIKQGKKILHYETLRLRKDGKIIHVSITLSPVFDIHGKMTAISFISRDITERKRAEEKLQESEEKYRNIIETANEGIFIMDAETRITYINKKIREMFGYGHKKIIGRPVWDFLSEEGKAIAKKNMEKRLQGINTSYELELIRKDGSRLWVLINAKSLFNKDGKFVGSLIMLTDINERKHAEEELRQARDELEIRVIERTAELKQSNDKLKAEIEKRKKAEKALKKARDTLEAKVKERTSELEEAYKSLKESEKRLSEAQRMAHIGNWDNDLVIGELYWSDEMYRIFGLNPREKITYDQFLSYVHPDDIDYVYNSTQKAIKGKIYATNYKIVRPDGEERIVHSEREVIFDEKNNPTRMRGTFQDITERKNAEEALVNIETARKKEIHHRIKNNLQVISSLLDLQAEKFNNREDIKDSEVMEAFRESQDRVRSMALIHEELYKDGGFETLNFSSYIKELADNLFLTYLLGNNYISLNMDLEENLFFDMDTAIPLGMIINELVSNSLKHAFIGRSKGEIRIKLSRVKTGKRINSIEESKNDNFESTSFTLTVLDNGIGIPENLDIEDLDSLGLQLVTSLVDQLDGELELKRNKGTEFTIRFTVVDKK